MRFTPSVGIFTLLAVLALPLAAGAQGARIEKVCLGPTGQPRARIADSFTCTITVTRTDDTGPPLRVDAIIDVVHHASGDVESGNLLASSVVLATTADSASAISPATVAPGDQNPLGDVATALVIDLDTNSPFTISGGGEVAVVACLADADCNDGNPCTLDQCGADNTCAHPAGNAGVTCRPLAGPCDIEEHCSGTSTDCPADTFLPTTEVCRPSAGV